MVRNENPSPNAVPAGEAATEEARPLDPVEEKAWRSLATALIRVPRILEAELEDEHNLTTAEYFVLVNLSEEPDGALRMTDLAERGALSLSGMSRVVDRLVRQGFVERRKCESDARGSFAALTPTGLSKLQAAYKTHIRGVRRHVMDHLMGIDLERFAEAMGRLAGGPAAAGGLARCPGAAAAGVEASRQD